MGNFVLTTAGPKPLHVGDSRYFFSPPCSEWVEVGRKEFIAICFAVLASPEQHEGWRLAKREAALKMAA